MTLHSHYLSLQLHYDLNQMCFLYFGKINVDCMIIIMLLFFSIIAGADQGWGEHEWLATHLNFALCIQLMSVPQ